MDPARLSLSVVIPAYNEEVRIGFTLSELQTYLNATAWDWEIRVVDDGSADRTCAVVEERASHDRRIVLQRETHRGKGGAVRAGLLAARRAYRFICDADLSMPVSELTRFLPPWLMDFDVAIGSREGHGARRIGEPLIRHLAGRAFNFTVRQLSVKGINDTQCGFKMFTVRDAITIFHLVSIGR